MCKAEPNKATLHLEHAVEAWVTYCRASCLELSNSPSCKLSVRYWFCNSHSYSLSSEMYHKRKFIDWSRKKCKSFLKPRFGFYQKVMQVARKEN